MSFSNVLPVVAQSYIAAFEYPSVFQGVAFGYMFAGLTFRDLLQGVTFRGVLQDVTFSSVLQGVTFGVLQGLTLAGCDFLWCDAWCNFPLCCRV